jgi:hypothetical protein
VPDFVVSATLVAVTWIDAVEGTIEGAVYSPVEFMVPVVELLPVVPFTCHVTRLSDVPVTTAEN